jgi:hypothetical protein
MRERDLLRRLVARLAHDRPIDWEEEDRAVQADPERATLNEIRVVAAVANFYRAVQAGDDTDDLSASVSLARTSTGPPDDVGVRREPRLLPGSRWDSSRSSSTWDAVPSETSTGHATRVSIASSLSSS